MMLPLIAIKIQLGILNIFERISGLVMLQKPAVHTEGRREVPVIL